MALSSSLANLALQERTRREIVHRSELIPSLPDVVLQVLRLVNDKGAEIQQFEDLLKNDGPLVAKMLRVVNSPFYAVQSHVTSIGQAVMVLGFRSLRSLVLAASTANYMERDYACYGYKPKGLWSHAIAVASGSRTLAKFLRQSADLREEVFVAGLLHDIGKMLLAPYLTEAGAEFTDQHASSAEFEQQILGIDHQEAGALIAEKWNLSPMVREVLRSHHEDQCEDEDHRICHAIVRLSNHYAHVLGIGSNIEPSTEAPCAADFDTLGLDADSWDEATFEMKETIEASLQTLSNLGG